jgi:hypothetical protein
MLLNFCARVFVEMCGNSLEMCRVLQRCAEILQRHVEFFWVCAGFSGCVGRFVPRSSVLDCGLGEILLLGGDTG